MISTQYGDIVAHQEILFRQISAVQSSEKSWFNGSAFSLTPRVYFLESEKRFFGLNMDYYQRAMTNQEFRAYLDFIGEETVDFHPSDFEVYYPEEEG